MARIVAALGGNALGNTPPEQRARAAEAAKTLAELIEQGNEIVVAHGNGPQVGMRQLERLTPEQARAYAEAGHFAPGSMLPKVEAAVKFAESAPARSAVICSLEKAPLALSGRSGTVIRASEVPLTAPFPACAENCAGRENSSLSKPNPLR